MKKGENLDDPSSAPSQEKVKKCEKGEKSRWNKVKKGEILDDPSSAPFQEKVKKCEKGQKRR